MKKFVTFINKHNILFSLLLVTWIIAFIFIPCVSNQNQSLFNILYHNLKLLKEFEIDTFSPFEISFTQNLIILLYIFIGLKIILSILLLIFHNKSCPFLIISVEPLIATIAVVIYYFANGVDLLTLSFGFYLAILIFAFFLFYYIADIIIHRKPKTAKTQKPKKPTTDDRIAALEKEIEELKNKKDDQ